MVNRPLPVGPGGPGGDRFLSYGDSATIPPANVNIDIRSGTHSYTRISSPPVSAYSNNPSPMGTVSVATSPMSQQSAAASFFAR